jgi:hypothetical protein
MKSIYVFFLLIFFISSNAFCKEKIIAMIYANDFTIIEQQIINEYFTLNIHKLLGLKFKIITNETLNEELKKLNSEMEDCNQECNLDLGKLLKAKYSFIAKVRKIKNVYFLVIELYDIKTNTLIDGFKTNFIANKNNRLILLNKALEKKLLKFKLKDLDDYKSLVISKEKINKNIKKTNQINNTEITLSELRKYNVYGNRKNYHYKNKKIEEEYFDIKLKNNIIYSLFIVSGITFTIGGLALLGKSKEEMNKHVSNRGTSIEHCDKYSCVGEEKKVVGGVFLTLGILTVVTSSLFFLGCNEFMKNVYEKQNKFRKNQIKTCFLNTNRMNKKFKSFKDNIRFKLEANQKSLHGFVSFNF